MKSPINKYTFQSKKIRRWVEQNSKGTVLNLFAGKTLLQCDEIRNDADKNVSADYHMDAFECVKLLIKQKKVFNTILLDPPYSYRKSMEFYQGHKVSSFNKIKDLLFFLLEQNGYVITFGYHSVSMGKRRCFEVEKILLISHGGAIHDTIATKERYIGIV